MKYLGETLITDLTNTPYADYNLNDWVLYFIGGYGQIDGAHHKQWVLDQVARIVNGTDIVVKLAKWEANENTDIKKYEYFHYDNENTINIVGAYRISTAEEPSEEYNGWVQEMQGDYDEENEEYEYDYDEGIAP